MAGFSMMLEVLPHAQGLPLPKYATSGSSGMDLYAAVDAPLVVKPGEVTLIPTGLKIALPEPFEAQIRARSGLAIKHGLCVLNGPGTVDSDYRGEVKVILANLGKEPFTVERGMRIAQMVIMRVEKPKLEVVDKVPDTVRGEGGFGSSGR